MAKFTYPSMAKADFKATASLCLSFNTAIFLAIAKFIPLYLAIAHFITCSLLKISL